MCSLAAFLAELTPEGRGVGRQPAWRARIGQIVQAGIIVASDIAITIARGARDARIKRVGDDGEAGRAPEIDAVIFAVGRFNKTVGAPIGFAREEFDGPANGVASGQGSLWTAQDLDALQVQ